jgi:uncharacterized protein with PIN domain
MWPDSGTPYLDMLIRDSIPRRNLKIVRTHLDEPNLAVVHHETCPCCGKTLKNLYLREVKKIVVDHGENVLKTSKEWKCNACWNKEEMQNG